MKVVIVVIVFIGVGENIKRKERVEQMKEEECIKRVRVRKK